tara:strand:- start:484 stop:702 length:219 start_codon:yes stop_codon:yes gene_type:complete
MRALYLETLRMLLNTVVCILIFAAGMEIPSTFLQIIAVVMYLSHMIASIERRITWEATKKKDDYREKFPKKN